MVDWGRGIFTEATRFTLTDVEGLSEMDPQMTNLFAQGFAYLKTPVPALPAGTFRPQVRVPLIENAFNFFLAACPVDVDEAFHHEGAPAMVFREADDFRTVAAREMSAQYPLANPGQHSPGLSASEPPMPMPPIKHSSTDSQSASLLGQSAQESEAATDMDGNLSVVRAFQQLSVDGHGRRATIGSTPGGNAVDSHEVWVNQGGPSVPPEAHRHNHLLPFHRQGRAQSISTPAEVTAQRANAQWWGGAGGSPADATMRGGASASSAPWPYNAGGGLTPPIIKESPSGGGGAFQQGGGSGGSPWRHMPLNEGETVMRTGGSTSVRELLSLHGRKAPQSRLEQAVHGGVPDPHPHFGPPSAGGYVKTEGHAGPSGLIDGDGGGGIPVGPPGGGASELHYLRLGSAEWGQGGGQGGELPLGGPMAGDAYMTTGCTPKLGEENANGQGGG
uniref:Uncharacterized protein n=1 Tax=Chromera velia CCMP2878 TaxID=1169474 RepID=A0A0G4G3S0_9ALVE|eukprot:Cvel_20152.t1-p1 / transcript=Cvel_20152.t1 / gene=Cvel_20152 / organism=Chromera_velia_CCMP2878 / gene_product=hypothetical protein / transcript_product=hypothetical protein / location=Cvel_scaffold1789:26143-28576(-) / protein_length=445 / sequence_SO=supercontig / SO=protein_coding / is_pseudo=false